MKTKLIYFNNDWLCQRTIHTNNDRSDRMHICQEVDTSIALRK